MAKSSGNIARVRDLLEAGYLPRAVRYSLISVHYRVGLNHSDESLSAAAAAVERLDALVGASTAFREERADDVALPDALAAAREAFGAALDDDLGISPALAVLFELVRDLNRRIDGRSLSTRDAGRALGLLRDLDQVLGVFPEEADALDPETAALLEARATARAARDWAALGMPPRPARGAWCRGRGHPRRAALAETVRIDPWLIDRGATGRTNGRQTGLAGANHRAPGTSGGPRGRPPGHSGRPRPYNGPRRDTFRGDPPGSAAPASGGAPTTSPTGLTGHPATTTRAPFNRIAAIEPADHKHDGRRPTAGSGSTAPPPRTGRPPGHGRPPARDYRGPRDPGVPPGPRRPWVDHRPWGA